MKDGAKAGIGWKGGSDDLKKIVRSFAKAIKIFTPRLRNRSK